MAEPNNTMRDLLDYAASLGFVVQRQNVVQYSIDHRTLRRPVRVNLKETGAFNGAGMLFGSQFKSVRGLRAFLTRIASSARVLDEED